MLSFHNDPKLKQKILDQLKAHYKADEIIKGIYWKDGKGCAVGCTIHSSNHASYEHILGIPIYLAILEDAIFEGLDNKSAKKFPIQFIEAIAVGIDLFCPKVFYGSDGIREEWYRTNKMESTSEYTKRKRKLKNKLLKLLREVGNEII